MELTELINFDKISKPILKLIDVVKSGLGIAARPWIVRRDAKATGDLIRCLVGASDESASKANVPISMRVALHGVEIDAKNFIQENVQLLESIQERAAGRLLSREIRRQENIENIILMSAEELKCKQGVSDEKADIDWISRYFSYAQEVSREEMQKVWAKVLSGEISSPRSFSLRTLDALRSMSVDEAQLFNKLCGYRVCLPDKSDVVIDFDSIIYSNKTDISLMDSLTLRELGLLNLDELMTDFEFGENNIGCFIYCNQYLAHIVKIKQELC